MTIRILIHTKNLPQNNPKMTPSFDPPILKAADFRSIYPSIYVALVNIIIQDPYIKQLQSTGEFEFDFLPYPEIAAEYTQPPTSTIPRDKPRLYLIRTSSNIEGLSSCQKKWTIGYNIVVQGLHLRSALVDQLAGQLDYLFSNTTFIQDICGQITSSASQFNYDVGKQTVTATLSISVVVATPR